MLFSSNPVNFVKSLRALAECKCDKDCNCQSVMKPSAKSLQSRRRRALSCLKKNAMQMQMVKWKRKLAARSQEAKVRDRASSRHVPHLTQFSRHIHYSWTGELSPPPADAWGRQEEQEFEQITSSDSSWGERRNSGTCEEVSGKEKPRRESTRYVGKHQTYAGVAKRSGILTMSELAILLNDVWIGDSSYRLLKIYAILLIDCWKIINSGRYPSLLLFIKVHLPLGVNVSL